MPCRRLGSRTDADGVPLACRRRTRVGRLDRGRHLPERVSEVKTYPLERANKALGDLRVGRLEGAAVLLPQDAGPSAEIR